MTAVYNTEAARELCVALGLDPARVFSLTLDLAAPGAFGLTVNYVLAAPELGEVVRVLSAYDVKLEKRRQPA